MVDRKRFESSSVSLMINNDDQWLWLRSSCHCTNLKQSWWTVDKIIYIDHWLPQECSTRWMPTQWGTPTQGPVPRATPVIGESTDSTSFNHFNYGANDRSLPHQPLQCVNINIFRAPTKLRSCINSRGFWAGIPGLIPVITSISLHYFEHMSSLSVTRWLWKIYHFLSKIPAHSAPPLSLINNLWFHC